MSTMMKGERNDLARLVRQRERLLKTAASQRAAEVLADFERQMGAQYSFDQDEIWKEAHAAAEKAVEAAKTADVRYHVGNIFSADLFYTPDPDMFETMARFNVLGVEMEAAGIFAIAAENNAEALAICTVSDDIVSGDALTSEDRATTFDEMILVALETVVAGS